MEEASVMYYSRNNIIELITLYYFFLSKAKYYIKGVWYKRYEENNNLYIG